MAVKLLISWLDFLLRTENLYTWQRSIVRTLKLSWFVYKQCLAIHTVIQFEQNTIAICGDIKWVCSREFHLFMHLLHMCMSVHSCSQYQACPLQRCEWSTIHSVLESAWPIWSIVRGCQWIQHRVRSLSRIKGCRDNLKTALKLHLRAKWLW